MHIVHLKPNIRHSGRGNSILSRTVVRPMSRLLPSAKGRNGLEALMLYGGTSSILRSDEDSLVVLDHDISEQLLFQSVRFPMLQITTEGYRQHRAGIKYSGAITAQAGLGLINRRNND